MKKFLITHFEKLMTILIVIAIGHSLVDAMIVARDQMYLAQEGAYGIFTFVIAFVVSFLVNTAKWFIAVTALYLLAEIKTLLAR